MNEHDEFAQTLATVQDSITDAWLHDGPAAAHGIVTSLPYDTLASLVMLHTGANID